MSDQVDVSVVSQQLEIAVIRRKPLIEYVPHFDAAISERDGAGRLLAAMSRVAFDLDDEQRVRHSIKCSARPAV